MSRVRVFVLPLALLLAFFAGRAQAACELSMRWSEDPPFGMRAANGEVVGINVDLAREALSRMGCSVRLVELPWARALAELEAGQIDVLPGMLPRAERSVYAYFALTRTHARNVLFMRAEAAERWHFERLADVRGTGFRLGAQIGVSYGPDYTELLHDPKFSDNLVRVSTRRNLWQMLKLGRIDGLIANELSARYELHELGLEQQVRLSHVVLSDEVPATGFSRKTVAQDFAARFERVSDGMVQDGTYKAILQRYQSAP